MDCSPNPGWPAWLAAVFVALTVPAQAHDPGLSTAALCVKPEAVDAVLTFALADVQALFPLDNNLDGRVSQEEFAYAKTRLAPLAAEALVIRFDRQPVIATEPSLSLDDQNNVHMVMSFPGRVQAQMDVQAALIASLAPGHRQLVTVTNASGRLLAERLLSAQQDELTVAVDVPDSATAQPAPVTTFWGFLTLGIEHILTGYDHLLFLFALLLVTDRFLPALKVITCFTVAHSITLGVAAFDLIQLPSQVVEPAIAASIVYVGVENILCRGEPKGRWKLTFAFGLIHGFGFASVLRGLGVGASGSGIAMPLFSFNLGVELGQILVAAPLLPLIWWLRHKPGFVTLWAPICSALVALAGGYWLVQRLFLA